MPITRPILALASVFVLASCGDDSSAGATDAGPMPHDGGSTRLDAGPSGSDSGGATSDSGSTTGDDAGEPADAGPPPARMDVEVAGGDVQGSWCGNVHVTADATVPAGATLEVCSGSSVTFDAGVKLDVAGTLRLAGTTDAHVLVGGDGWSGLHVVGTIDGAFADVGGAMVCLDGGAGSSVTMTDSTFAGCRYTARLANGATLDRTHVGDGSVYVTGGELRMTDTIVDLGHPRRSPDCVVWTGGGATLDHVRLTGCHCSMHVDSASSPLTITSSVLDGNVYGAMLASVLVTFTGNDLDSSGAHLQDIGGGIDAQIAGNYWQGGAPTIDATDLTQFHGGEGFATEPFAGAGPR